MRCSMTHPGLPLAIVLVAAPFVAVLQSKAMAPLARVGGDYIVSMPIVAGEQGLTYFTLRARSDPGACMLATPGVKEAIRPSKRRFILKGASDLRIATPEAMRARKETVLDAIVEPHADGLAAWMLRLPVS